MCGKAIVYLLRTPPAMKCVGGARPLAALPCLPSPFSPQHQKNANHVPVRESWAKQTPPRDRHLIIVASPFVLGQYVCVTGVRSQRAAFKGFGDVAHQAVEAIQEFRFFSGCGRELRFAFRYKKWLDPVTAIASSSLGLI